MNKPGAQSPFVASRLQVDCVCAMLSNVNSHARLYYKRCLYEIQALRSIELPSVQWSSYGESVHASRLVPPIPISTH
jgi:hypothetical protein